MSSPFLRMERIPVRADDDHAGRYQAGLGWINDHHARYPIERLLAAGLIFAILPVVFYAVMQRCWDHRRRGEGMTVAIRTGCAMTQRVLIEGQNLGDVEIETEILEAAGAGEIVMAPELNGPGLPSLLPQVDALMVTLQSVPASLIAELGQCKIICRVGTGVDAIDIPAATVRGIWVTNVPDYSIDEVSTHAISLVLAQARNLFAHREAARAGDWRYSRTPRCGASPARRLGSSAWSHKRLRRARPAASG